MIFGRAELQDEVRVLLARKVCPSASCSYMPFPPRKGVDSRLYGGAQH